MFINILSTKVFQVLKVMASSFSLTLLYFSLKTRNSSSRNNVLFTKLVYTVFCKSDQGPDSASFFHTKLYFMPPVIFPKKMHLSQDIGISPRTKNESHLKREQSKKYQNEEYQKPKWLVLQPVFSCLKSLPAGEHFSGVLGHLRP